MLERFLVVKNCVVKALADLNQSNLWKDSFTEQMEQVVQMLVPVKLSVEALFKMLSYYIITPTSNCMYYV